MLVKTQTDLHNGKFVSMGQFSQFRRLNQWLFCFYHCESASTRVVTIVFLLLPNQTPKFNPYCRFAVRDVSHCLPVTM
jgi:hypothetical protein